ncbi:sugar ABC transporter permease [Candidatus Aerophobetes bacterium]|nr:sugar ABC transporter permease [Candidatus Aerophobetes bacterium]
MRKITDYWFIIPVIGIISATVLYPLGYGFWVSFYKTTISGNPVNFIGFGNYLRALYSPVFYQTVVRTFYYTAVCIFVKTLLGLGAALLLNQEFKGKGILRGLTIIPWTMPLFVVAIMWYGIFEWKGPLNTFLRLVGLSPVSWFSFEWAMDSVIIINIWKGFPFYFMGFLAGMQGIPQELYEAAEIDGASSWHKFKSITLPALRPVLLTILMLSTIWTFSEFVTIFLTTRGGPGSATQTMSILVYETAFGAFEVNYALTLSILILPFFLALIYFTVKLLTR